MHTVGTASAENGGLNVRHINELNLREASHEDGAKLLPHPGDPKYSVTVQWECHLISHEYTVSPDFVVQVREISLLMHIVVVVVFNTKYS